MRHLSLFAWLSGLLLGASSLTPEALATAAPRPCAGTAAPPVLRVDAPIRGEITTADTREMSVGTVGLGPFGEAYSKSFPIEIAESGAYFIEMRSLLFDSYLVLRDAEGNIVAEDDDGLGFRHARMILPMLREGGDYTIVAFALHGGTGGFEIRLRQGEPETLAAPARLEQHLTEARESLEAIQSALGADHVQTGICLRQLAMAQAQVSDLDAARVNMERALTILEKHLDHDDLVIVGMYAALVQMRLVSGDHEGAQQLAERRLSSEQKSGGQNSPSIATALRTLARVHQHRGDFLAAKPLAERALAIMEASSTADDPDVAFMLSDLGMICSKLGDYQSALSLLERAIAILERTLGPEHAVTGELLQDLGALLLRLDDVDGGHAYLERALAIHEATYGDVHPWVASALNELAFVAAKRGDLYQARDLQQKATTIYEQTRGADHTDTASSMMNLASHLKELGENARARAFVRRTLKIHESVFGPEHPTTASTLRRLASLSGYAEARPLQERALAICERVFGPEHPETALCQNELGIFYGSIGDHEKSVELIERARATMDKFLGPEHELSLGIAGSLAVSYWQAGDHKEAVRLFETTIARAEKKYGPDHLRLVYYFGNLASIASETHGPERSEVHARRALSILDRSSSPNDEMLATTLNNLAVALIAQGKGKEACIHLERARTVSERVEGPFGDTTLQILMNQVLNLAFDVAPDRAVALARDTIENMRVHRDRGNWSLTEAERLRFVKILRRSLDIFLSVSRPIAGEQGATERYEMLLDWKAHVFRSMHQTRRGLMTRLSEETRARIDELASLQSQISNAVLRKDVDDRTVHQETLARLRRERQNLELGLTRSLGSSQGPRTPKAAELIAALPAQSALVDFFVHELYETKEPDPVTGRVPTGWSSPKLSAWILRPGAETIVEVDLGDAAAVEAATSSFLREIVASRGVAPVGDAGGSSDGTTAANERLRALLWDPLARHLTGAKRIVVSPDGFLGTLPFEIIQTSDRRFLIEQHAFIYVECAASILDYVTDDGRGTGELESSLLCIGDVDYRKRDNLAWQKASDDKKPDAGPPDDGLSKLLAADTPTYQQSGSDAPNAGAVLRNGFLNRWWPLPATQEESVAVSMLHEERFEEGSQLVLQGRSATEERIKRELPRHDVVHLATHGFFQPEGLPSMWKQVQSEDGVDMEMFKEDRRILGLMPGLLSGLVLAGANRTPEAGRDDGLLTAEEVSYLDLSRTRLVVLSACETALGTSESGEGMMGLRRAFRQAGARTVISSLWSVKDDSTSQLMQNFHDRRWGRGQATLDALRGAQLDMLKQNRIENDGGGLPSTWGAFVLDGAWR